MADTKAEILTGGVVLAAAAAFAVWAGLGAGLGGSGGKYDLTASFRSLQGISPGAEVRMSGVAIGEISKIVLNPQTFFADATVTIRDDIQLPDDSAILVSQDGLLGGAYIEIVPGGSPMNIEPGGEIVDTQGAVSLMSLLMRFVGGSGSSDGGSDAAAPDASGAATGGGASQ
ncbi:outer membrane lipid asymmetry maintenance protein MlaD [Frigidibacter sp. MR17.24]|uniref:outer membrane lipid asymmetry maintenance protein MlaD n=1 Tax=Frigidibacter sp. MR17.24 TaxID=3127345 RepID=UPI0030131D10